MSLAERPFHERPFHERLEEELRSIEEARHPLTRDPNITSITLVITHDAKLDRFTLDAQERGQCYAFEVRPDTPEGRRYLENAILTALARLTEHAS